MCVYTHAYTHACEGAKCASNFTKDHDVSPCLKHMALKRYTHDECHKHGLTGLEKRSIHSPTMGLAMEAVKHFGPAPKPVGCPVWLRCQWKASSHACVCMCAL